MILYKRNQLYILESGYSLFSEHNKPLFKVFYFIAFGKSDANLHLILVIFEYTNYENFYFWFDMVCSENFEKPGFWIALSANHDKPNMKFIILFDLIRAQKLQQWIMNLHTICQTREIQSILNCAWPAPRKQWKGGFPIEIETRTSKLIEYSKAIFLIMKIAKVHVISLLIYLFFFVLILIGNRRNFHSKKVNFLKTHYFFFGISLIGLLSHSSLEDNFLGLNCMLCEFSESWWHVECCSKVEKVGLR